MPLTTLAGVYDSQSRYREVEPLFESVLQLHRETLGEAHPHRLAGLSNLALSFWLLRRQINV
ncbi:MAG: tetratricopeptide repeat protein [Geminicoccaceae bacterium]